MLSYTRRRAEGLGVPLRGRRQARTERILLLVVGLLINQLVWALWLLGILSNITAVQRMWLVWREIGEE